MGKGHQENIKKCISGFYNYAAKIFAIVTTSQPDLNPGLLEWCQKIKGEKSAMWKENAIDLNVSRFFSSNFFKDHTRLDSSGASCMRFAKRRTDELKINSGQIYFLFISN